MEEGNIWDYYNNDANNNEKEDRNYIICPTNIGWNNKKENVMGAGIAKEVKIKFPEVPLRLGYFYRLLYYAKSLMNEYEKSEDISFCYFHKLLFYKNIIFLPTKELNKDKPWLSWKNNSSLDLIEEGISNLKKLFDHESFKYNNKDHKVQCIIPMIGCGCGKLDSQDVIKILEKYLRDDDRFILIKKEK